MCMGHVILGLGYCSSLDQELMGFIRSWTDIEEGREERSAHIQNNLHKSLYICWMSFNEGQKINSVQNAIPPVPKMKSETGTVDH